MTTTPTAPQPGSTGVAPTTRRGGRGKLVGAAALALAVAGAGIVGWQVFGPGGGGAESPEAAAEQFITSVADQDGVGMLSVVNPGEVEGLDEVYESARDRLEEEGLISGDGLSDAVDLAFEDLEFDVDELGEGVARVTLSDGTVTASYDPGKLPERLEFVQDEFPDGESETINISRELRDVDIELGVTVVEIDGEWYVSLLGTAADIYYQDYDHYYGNLRKPDYDAVAEEVDPVVGASPEDVIENIVEAANESDVQSLVDQLPSDLAVVLRPYAPTIERFLDDQEISATVTQDDLELEVEDLDDGLVKVTVEEAEFSAEGSSYDDYASGGVTIYDACVEAVDYEYGYEDGFCVPDNLLDDLGIERPYVLMREVDDGYQLDPVATLTSYASTVIEAFPSEVIDELLRAIEDDDDGYVECRYGDYCYDDEDE